MNPDELLPVDASLRLGKRLADQMGFTAFVQLSVVPPDPIHIPDLHKCKFITSTHREPLDQTFICFFFSEVVPNHDSYMHSVWGASRYHQSDRWERGASV